MTDKLPLRHKRLQDLRALLIRLELRREHAIARLVRAETTLRSTKKQMKRLAAALLIEDTKKLTAPKPAPKREEEQKPAEWVKPAEWAAANPIPPPDREARMKAMGFRKAKGGPKPAPKTSTGGRGAMT